MFSSNAFVNKLTVDMMNSPFFSDLISPEFIKKPPVERFWIYEKFPELKKNNITIGDIEYISQDLQYLQIDYILKEVVAIVKWLIAKQEKDGSWKFLTKQNLIDFRHENPREVKEIEAFFENNGGKKSKTIANAWINSLATLLLSKFELLKKRHNLLTFLVSSSPQASMLLETVDIASIKKVIDLSVQWLNDNRNFKGEFSGWGPLPPNISKESLNTYDTSFGYISAHFGGKIFGDEVDGVMPIEIGALLPPSPLYDLQSGGWRAESGLAPDTGATSYAILCLMKYIKDSNSSNVPMDIIEKAVEWLVDLQSPGGFWGKVRDGRPRLDRTCHVLIALMKFNKFKKQEVIKEKVIANGINYLKSKLVSFHNYKDCNGIIFCWPNEKAAKGQHPCFKNSSLTISTLLRYLPPTTPEIQRGISSLLRLYKDTHKKRSARLNSPDELYFWCMLISYLKSLHATEFL